MNKTKISKNIAFEKTHSFVAKDVYDCYVYQCYNCGNIAYLNKDQNQLKVINIMCKCGWNPKYNHRWILIGEGNYDTKSIHYPKPSQSVSNSYTEAIVFGNNFMKGMFHR